MFDWDAIIVGGGPAGLTAGIYLSRAKRRVVLLDKEGGGGYLSNIEMIENYPGFSEGISGAELASQMILQARKYGLEIEIAEVTGIELFSSTRVVNCSDGKSYTAGAIIFTGGSRNKKLNVPGEAELAGKGVFECAMCDGGGFVGKVVAVCGGGDSGLTEALYMAKLASKVYVIELMPKLNATAIMQERVAVNKNITVITGAKVEAIEGKESVEGITVTRDGKKETIKVDGVLVHIGLDPNTNYLEGTIPLDKHGQVIVNENMETKVPYVFAAGDIRSNSPRQVVVAVGDGAIAAINAERLLQKQA